MGHFDKGGRKGGGGFRGGRSAGRDGGGFRGGRDSGGFRGSSSRPQMHHATCSKCGDDCEVPFRPTGSKPVFCSNCFEKNDSSSNYRGANNRHVTKDLYKADCSECGSLCEIPFAPRPGRAVLCDACFSKQKKAGSGGNNTELAQKIDALHAKIDRVLKLLGENDKSISPKTTKVTEAVSEKKPSTKKKVAPEISFDESSVKKSSKKTTAKKADAKKTVKKVVKKAVKKTTKKSKK